MKKWLKHTVVYSVSYFLLVAWVVLLSRIFNYFFPLLPQFSSSVTLLAVASVTVGWIIGIIKYSNKQRS